MHRFLEKYFETIKKFIPEKTSDGASVGIDIGVSNCKLVEVVKSGSEIELLTLAQAPIQKGDVKAAVSSILEKSKNPVTAPYTSVFGKGTLIRYIKMPRMSVDDLKSSFDVESDKYFPFASDQIYTDCFILDPNGKEKQMSVLATAVRRELVDKRVELLQELGLEPSFIGINPIALCNALSILGFEGEDKEKDSVVALLDLGDSVSNLNILVDRIPRFTRDIFIGGRDFTVRISNALGVSIEEAEKLKANPKGKTKEIASACESTVMNIIEELMLSLEFFSTEYNMSVKHLLITGGASLLKGISEIFEKHLEVKVTNWDPLASLKVSEGEADQKEKQNSLKYGVALGLALYDYD